MKKNKLAALLLFLLPSLAHAQGIGYLRKEVSPDGGGVTPYPLVTVCTSGADLKTLPCTPKVSIYTDDSLVTPKANPFRGGADGSIEFHATPGTYIVSITAPYSPGYSFKVVLTTGAGGGIITTVTGSDPIASSGGTTPNLTCPSCMKGSLDVEQVAVGTVATQTVGGSSALKFHVSGATSTLSVGDANSNVQVVTDNVTPSAQIQSSNTAGTAGQVSLAIGNLAGFQVVIDAILGREANFFGGQASPGGTTFYANTAKSCTAGTTSGLFCWQLAAAAGTPNPIVPPLTTGGANQVLKTDGGNPQQLSWADQTSGTNFGTPPTTPNITFLACDVPSGGVAVPGFCWPGTPGRTVAGASDTILSTDRAGCVLYTNGGAVAVTVPQAGTTNFANNFQFCAKAATTTAVTLTPTTSQIAGNNGTVGSSLAVPASSTAYCYSWDNTNYQCTLVLAAGTGSVTSVATTSPITGGTITGTGTIACATCVVASSPGAGVAHFAGSTQTVTSSAIVGADMTNNTVTATQLATQYAQWLACDGKGIGDGLNAMAAGTYLMSTCRNTTGVTVTITGIKCFTDNSGTSTLNASGNTLGALLTGAVTCTSSYASGTQSANILLTANDYIKFTFVADGTSKQTDWVVTGTF